MPVTLIERTQGVSRATVYNDIARARQIFRLDESFSRDLFFETSESLREAWQNYQNADNRLRTANIEIPERTALETQKSTYLGMIDKMLRTRIEAAKLLIPKTETLSVETVKTETGEGVRFELKRESKNVGVLLEELRKEGKIGGGEKK